MGDLRRQKELALIKEERAALRTAYLREFSALEPSYCGLFPAMTSSSSLSPSAHSSSQSNTQKGLQWSMWCEALSFGPKQSSAEEYLDRMSNLTQPVSHSEWLRECRKLQPVHTFLRRGKGAGGGAGVAEENQLHLQEQQHH